VQPATTPDSGRRSGYIGRFFYTLCLDNPQHALGGIKMIKKIRTRAFTIASSIIAAVFWSFDSALHYIIYNDTRFEIIPDDYNELWMRLVIVSLIVLFGIYADAVTRKRMIQEKQLAALQTYNSMICATHHILNNLLNQMQLFRMTALRSTDFDRETIRLYDNAIDEAQDLLGRLSRIENITEENILASVDPGKLEYPPGKPEATGTENPQG